MGSTTGGAITAYDRLYLPYRFGLLVSAQKAPGSRILEPTSELQSLKLQTELGLGYRFMLAEAGFFTTYLVPQVGMAFGWEHDVIMHRTPVVDAGCVDLTCPITTDTVENRQSRWFWRPTVGVGLQASVFELGYSVQLDTLEPGGLDPPVLSRRVVLRRPSPPTTPVAFHGSASPRLVLPERPLAAMGIKAELTVSGRRRRAARR